MTDKSCFLFKETDAQFPTIQKREVTVVSMHIKYQEAGRASLESTHAGSV